MYDSRTDADTLRAKNGVGFPSTRTWGEGEAWRNPFVARAWREMGRTGRFGDVVEYGTPKARRLATKRAERKAIAEGLAEYRNA